MKILALLVLIVFVQCQELKVVENFDLQGYLGNWYEVVSSPIVHQTFERNAYCARATYGLKNDGTISVHNQQRDSSPQGRVRSIDGYAYSPDQSEPAKLKVDFGFAPGDYWIIKLGPKVNGQYQYSIVSEPRKLFLWVLARDPYTYFEQYGEENRELLENYYGFTGLFNKYVERPWDGCVPYK